MASLQHYLYFPRMAQGIFNIRVFVCGLVEIDSQDLGGVCSDRSTSDRQLSYVDCAEVKETSGSPRPVPLSEMKWFPGSFLSKLVHSPGLKLRVRSLRRIHSCL